MNRKAVLFILILFAVFETQLVQSAPNTKANANDSVKVKSGEKKAHFQIRPSLGLTYGDSNAADGSTTKNLQWLGTVNSDLDYIGKKFDLSSTLFAQYGESKINGQPSEKVQDAFILSITPSIPLIKLPPIRLFLETTAETNLGKGMIDDKPTSFLDPMFLYQTLFLGQKHYSYEKGAATTWQLTYGVGYAFQQTLNKNFKVEKGISGNRSDFESGFSGIIEFAVNSQISKSLSFVMNAKAVALSRENFFQDYQSSRRSILVRSGLFYNKVGMEYNFHQVHDLNLSANALTDQSIMLTLTF